MQLLDIAPDWKGEELAPEPILYDENLTGPDEMRFTLFPEENLHSALDVVYFKQWLRKNRDVVQIEVKWLIKSLFNTMSTSERQFIANKQGKWLCTLNASGYAGIMPPMGMIVDRRRHKEAITIPENSMLGIAKPKKL